MRFEVTRVLDTIEQNLTTDVALAQAVVDVGAVARHAHLDGYDSGRPVNLLRIGMVVDAFSRHLASGGVMLYGVAGRTLLADQELTPKERMVLGRWTGDGLIEVVGEVGDRVVEVGDLTALPVLSIDGYPQYVERYPWLRHRPDRVLRIEPHQGGARLAGVAPLTPSSPDGPGATLLARAWHCPRMDCPSFGDLRTAGQPVPRLRSGVPICPRHDEPLANLGPRPPAVTLAAVVDGIVRTRFTVRPGRPVVVGRAPDDQGAVELGPWLAGDAARWISRNHLRLEMHDEALLVTDTSTNGTVLRARSGPATPAERVNLTAGRSYPVSTWDTVELHTGVEIGRADRILAQRYVDPGSVLSDAPTIALRPPL